MVAVGCSDAVNPGMCVRMFVQSQRSLMTAGEQATGLVSGTWGVSESTIGRLHAIVAGLSMWACKLATAANAGVAGVAGLISTQLGALFAWPLSLAHGMWECMKTNVGTLGETTAVGAPAAHGPYQVWIFPLVWIRCAYCMRDL